MANTVLSSGAGFPASTTVKAYKLSDVENLIHDPINRGPRPGTAEDSATTSATCTTTFTTLTTGTLYAAHASISGRNHYVIFAGS